MTLIYFVMDIILSYNPAIPYWFGYFPQHTRIYDNNVDRIYAYILFCLFIISFVIVRFRFITNIIANLLIFPTLTKQVRNQTQSFVGGVESECCTT